jgi:hypothetical protein
MRTFDQRSKMTGGCQKNHLKLIFGSSMNLRIPNVVSLISECWELVERNIIMESLDTMADFPEEEITSAFYRELKKELKKRSDLKEIEKALKLDLGWCTTLNLDTNDQHRLSQGWKADVFVSSKHRRAVEARTGGDYGLVFSRPDISIVDNGFRFNEMKRGLLCQAKLRNFRRVWDPPKVNQIKNLRDKTDYLAFLLYEYTDGRTGLAPFSWHSTKGRQIEDAIEWFEADSFPDRMSSKEILDNLANGQIGTENSNIINEIIVPEENTYFIIRITKDSGDPYSGVITKIRGDNYINVNGG